MSQPSNKSKRFKTNDGDVLLVDGIHPEPGAVLVDFEGNYSDDDRVTVIAAWAAEHCEIINDRRRPGYRLGFRDTFMSVVLSTLRGAKWRELLMEVHPPVPDLHPESFFTTVKPNKFVHEVGFLAATKVGLDMLDFQYWVKGSYISTAPTPLGMMKLIDKLSQPAIVWSVDQRVVKVCIAELIRKIFKTFKPVKFKWDYNTIKKISFKASSGVGFPFRPKLDKNPKKKQYKHEVHLRISKLCRLLAEGEPVFKHINVGIAKGMFKPEIKGPQDEPGKIRHITQFPMDCDGISDMMDRPIMTYLQTLPWYSPGMSLYTSMINNTLLALGHKIYKTYLPIYQNRTFREAFPGQRIHYICLDQSTQDGRFVKSTLELTYRMRTYGHDFKRMTPEDLRVFMQLLLYVDVCTFHKIIQWFDGAYYNQFQSNSSGDKFTTVANCVEQEFVIRVAITTLLIEARPSLSKPWVVAQSFPMIICGDNSVLTIPDDYLAVFTSDFSYPDKLEQHLHKIGIVLKRDETFICLSTDSHVDPFFSTIENDKIIQRGVVYLQRYFVKVDEDNTLLPADFDGPFKLGLWRPTHHFYMRSMHHNFNWDHPSKTIAVALFQKSFALLFDAGYNLTAHRYLRQILRELVAIYPNIFEWSTSSMDLAELKIKVAYEDIWMKYVLEEDSFEFVTAQMSPTIASTQLRYPVWKNIK
jgi:hypothetical protein